MNTLHAIGRIGRDAEVRHTQKGTAVASFSLAVDVGFGENKATQWYNCSLFGARAEGGLVDYLKKGQQVGITGSPRLNQYTNNDGETKSSIDVNLDDVTLVGGRPEEADSAPAPAQAVTNAPASIDVTEDVPFMNPYAGKYYVG